MDSFELQLEGHETLVKFAVFLVVQTLVYLILFNSSGVFSAGAAAARSASFRRPVERSGSARRMAALLAEMPRFGGEQPSTPAGSQRGGRTSNDDAGDVADVELELELMLICCSFSS